MFLLGASGHRLVGVGCLCPGIRLGLDSDGTADCAGSPPTRLARPRAGVMFGWVVAAHQLAAAAAALGAGAIRSWMGDYQRAFLTSGVLCLITAAFVLQIGRPRPRRADLGDALEKAAGPGVV